MSLGVLSTTYSRICGCIVDENHNRADGRGEDKYSHKCTDTHIGPPSDFPPDHNSYVKNVKNFNNLLFLSVLSKNDPFLNFFMNFYEHMRLIWVNVNNM